MIFDNELVRTVFTKYKVKKGEYGWVGKHSSDILNNHGKFDKLERIKNLHKAGTEFPFATEHNNYRFFYPAPYVMAQAKWVKDNNIKIGSQVKIVDSKGWRQDDLIYVTHYIGKVGKVIGINKNLIELQLDNCKASVPYYALKKIDYYYRGFENDVEFTPYRDDWFSFGTEKRAHKVKYYCDTGVLIDTSFLTYQEFCERCVFTDTRKPAGVLVC